MTATAVPAPKTFMNLYGKHKRAESNYDLGNKVLRVCTWKSLSGALISHATVCEVDGHFFKYLPYSDFSKHLVVSNNRVTAKAVESQHLAALALVTEEFLAEIDLYYATKA